MKELDHKISKEKEKELPTPSNTRLVLLVVFAVLIVWTLAMVSDVKNPSQCINQTNSWEEIAGFSDNYGSHPTKITPPAKK